MVVATANLLWARGAMCVSLSPASQVCFVLYISAYIHKKSSRSRNFMPKHGQNDTPVTSKDKHTSLGPGCSLVVLSWECADPTAARCSALTATLYTTPQNPSSRLGGLGALRTRNLMAAQCPRSAPKGRCGIYGGTHATGVRGVGRLCTHALPRMYFGAPCQFATLGALTSRLVGSSRLVGLPTGRELKAGVPY